MGGIRDKKAIRKRKNIALGDGLTARRKTVTRKGKDDVFGFELLK
jgi:hypothetical protein